MAKSELSTDQYTELFEIFSGTNLDVQDKITQFIVNQKDEVLKDLLVRFSGSKKKHLRLGAMKVMVECNRMNKLSTTVQELVVDFRNNKNLTADEIAYLNQVLDQKDGSETFEDILKKENAEGCNDLFILLTAMGKNEFAFKPWNSIATKLTFKIMRCSPAAGDTKEKFKELAEQYKLPASRLVDIMFHAPSGWEEFVVYALGQDRLIDAIDLISSHVIDIKRFKSIYADLGEQMWEILVKSSHK